MIATLIGGSLAGCGPEPVAAPVPTASPPTFTAPISAAQPLGVGQDVRTPELAARVTVAGTLSTADRYAVRVTVQVLRGTYEFGPAMARLHHATGPDTTPAAGRAVPPVAFTLHAGVTQRWEITFDGAAGHGAQIRIAGPAGDVLAWTVR
ncbi:hypothetical protein Acy02nite_29910 [Actinoplanes cyaneus]|uniref:Uncharacterized protein n=2 Tax=Actinoplanes cyaneus TaxID=52696 RepID=A0A919IN80_9ACTN|nr:hypothetical protein [Actinoplanes cyaneus]GID65110.1 hypothetical protein Acy02nite_29910 [Actinoplanes cyaneus]